MLQNYDKTAYGTVYLVGAGPGDAGFLTIRGQQLLQSAEVVLYDRLANPALLQEVSDDCTVVYVGKRDGAHSMTQEEINALLIGYAKEGKTVVRLKGGDPFVFGRGGEEALALDAEGIPYEIVPGVTSAIGALAAAGIPVTHRGAAESFHVITGHTKEDLLPEHLAGYAALSGTLVFLMGVGHLQELADGLMQEGKSADCPAAVVQQGTTIFQRRIDGTLGTIAALAKEQHIVPPAILVVGETAAMHLQSSRLPLAGCRIAVTGTKELVKKQCSLLRAQGAWVLPVPSLQIAERTLDRQLLETILQAEWLVFTSANGVRTFFALLEKNRIDNRAFGSTKFAVIGKGTAEALKAHGIYADYMPESYTVEVLARGLVKQISGCAETGAEGAGQQADRQPECMLPQQADRQPECVLPQQADSQPECRLQAEDQNGQPQVCVLRAAEGSKRLNEILDAAGISYVDIAVYDTVPVENEPLFQEFKKALTILDYVTFSSASGVHAFAESMGKNIPFHGQYVCIGEQTADALRKQQICDDGRIFVAKQADSESLAVCIQKANKGAADDRE